MFVVFSFSYSKNGGFKDISFKNVFISEVIKNKQTIVPFSINEIEIKNDIIEDPFTITLVNVPDNLIKTTNLKISNVTLGSHQGDSIFFTQGNTIKFSLEGNIILGNRITENTPLNVVIGRKAGTENFVTLNLNNYINFLYPVEVKVNKHMDLGTGIAGTTLDTHNNGGYAIVEVTGEAGKNIKLKILEPKSIKISKGSDFLPVEVKFDENQSTDPYIFRQTIPFTSPSNKYTGKIDNIKIHGKCTSNAETRGKYTGSFVVRVEYDG